MITKNLVFDRTLKDNLVKYYELACHIIFSIQQENIKTKVKKKKYVSLDRVNATTKNYSD